MSKLVLECTLPKNWTKTNLENTVEILDGKRIPINSRERQQRLGNVPYYGATGQVGTIDDYLFDEELVLLGEDGAPFFDSFKSKAYLIHGKSWVNNHAHVLKGIFELLNNQFLCYYLNQIDYHEYVSGTTRLKLNQSSMKMIPIILPPLNEQKRIVEKIKELFSELDSIKSTLKNIQSQLDEYEQSLLKFAFEGKLTKKWREENNPSLEDVLKNIEKGKKNQDKKLRNIVPDEVAFFEIPDEWNWIKVGTVSKEVQYGTSEKATTTKSKIPVLRMGNIQNGELDFNKLKYYPNNWKNFKTFELVSGDVLFNRTNSAELVGKTAVYQKHHPSAVFAGYLIRVKIIDNAYFPSLLSHYINSVFGRLYINSVVTQQVGQANVNSTKLFMMPLPLLSFEEQKELISKLDSGFFLIKNSKNIVNSLLYQLDVLRSTILKQAFEGKLLPQNPNDEPAEILLQKIKAKKEQLKQKQKIKRRSKNVK